jgi:monoamine oxidase
MTMQQLINKISWTGFTRQTLTIFYTVSLASNPKEVSALYALWYTKNCQGLLRMITTENGGQV